MASTALAFLAILLAAGCLVPQAPTPTPPAGLTTPFALPCDARAEPGRIRAREIDLAVDPHNPDRLAAGLMVSIPSTRQSPPDDEPLWTRVLRSDDAGRTWKGADLSGFPGSPTAATSPFAGSAIIGDPIVTFLPDGALLLLGIMIQADYSYAMFSARFVGDSLEPSDVVVFSRGAWGDPSLSPVPSPGTVLYNDKEDVWVDQATGTVYASWMWRFNDPTQGIRSVPVVVMSTDGAKSWTPPKMLFGGLGGGARADDANVGQAPFTTRDGRTHIVWSAQRAKTLLMSSAPTGTLDFGPAQVIATDVQLTTSARAIGFPLPSVAVGPSSDGAGESVYVAWADSRYGDADVLVIRSDDAGATWSAPMRVNPQPVKDGTDQLVPAIAVSDRGVLGAHYVSFSKGRERYDAEASLSFDGGRTFQSAVVSAVPTWIANATGQRVTGIQAHVGDYFGAAFSGDTFVSMWQDGRDGTVEQPFTAAYACRLVVLKA